jgi:hypothetical protein
VAKTIYFPTFSTSDKKSFNPARQERWEIEKKSILMTTHYNVGILKVENNTMNMARDQVRPRKVGEEVL